MGCSLQVPDVGDGDGQDANSEGPKGANVNQPPAIQTRHSVRPLIIAKTTVRSRKLGELQEIARVRHLKSVFTPEPSVSIASVK